jgi:hypothetical protein
MDNSEWITPDAALKRLAEAYQLNVWEAEEHLERAMDRNLRLSIQLGNGNMQRVRVKSSYYQNFGPGKFVLNVLLNFDHLRWLVERQLKTDKLRSTRTNFDENTEEKCRQWLSELLSSPRRLKENVFVEARTKWPELSDAALKRCWASEAPGKGWSKQGRPRKNKTP